MNLRSGPGKVQSSASHFATATLTYTEWTRLAVMATRANRLLVAFVTAFVTAYLRTHVTITSVPVQKA